MGKRITQTQRRSKRKDIFFNFNKLRQTLSTQEKEKIKSFFSKLRPIYKEVQNNLFKLNQKFDSLEVMVKSFQQNYVKEPIAQKETDEFVLNEDDINQLLNSNEKKIFPKGKYEDYKNNSYDNEEEQNEQRPQKIINKVNYSERCIDYKKLSSGGKQINLNDNNRNVIDKMVPMPGRDFRQETFSCGLKRDTSD